MSDVEGEDEFQDAQETITRPTTMDLDRAIDEAEKSINLFFNNDFESAKKILEPWADTSMYHSLGTAIFACIEAFLTVEQQSIAKLSEALKLCMNVCSKQRRHVTLPQYIGKMVTKTNYDNYTDEEVHAELCYAESLLLKAMLTFIEDETLVSFVKAGLKIRTCFFIYKECLIILKSRNWTNEAHRLHFESGVRMGIGTFNLMISLLPGRVIKLLQFIGFSADKEYGLRELQLGYNEKRGMRQVLCVITLLSYHLIVTFILSHTDGDLDFCKEALDEQLDLYPNSVWFLFFKGRLEFTQGNMDESIEWYKKSWKSQEMWPQFHHLCFWELMWVHCIKQEWDEALFYAISLAEKSNWSRTIYLYQQAAIMIMRKPDAKSSDRDCISNLMMQVPTYKQRIAGKSLPMEKFICKKSERYFSQSKTLVVPIFELMFLWNIFRIAGKRKELIMSLYKAIENEEKSLKSSSKTDYDADNTALLLLLKGACLRLMDHPLLAEDCLRQIIKMEKQIKEDTYLVPYAVVELAVLARDNGDIATAIALLEDAKRNYTGYFLESRLHFRIHADLLELNNKKVGNGTMIEVAEEA
ncbi:tetratricopeptide repeat protein 39B-like [Diachasmimorpha longicaudata]|uniref:tetratricopeptide repeat protein 39B-like n=1 Tax=Diachasmimorpha longicaudata TaxID=58733 RepID=UPI0030B8B47B